VSIKSKCCKEKVTNFFFPKRISIRFIKRKLYFSCTHYTYYYTFNSVTHLIVHCSWGNFMAQYQHHIISNNNTSNTNFLLLFTIEYSTYMTTLVLISIVHQNQMIKYMYISKAATYMQVHNFAPKEDGIGHTS